MKSKLYYLIDEFLSECADVARWLFLVILPFLLVVGGCTFVVALLIWIAMKKAWMP